MDEVLLIDKPKGWTSFDVVAKIRGQLRRETGDKKVKVGHAGTLDPMATGLLIVLTGKMTKQQDTFMKKDKVYEAEITLGAISNTDDAEGTIVPTLHSPRPTLQRIGQVIHSFLGEIEQMPPNFSAIKINGQKAYDLARKGKQPELKSRKVTIFDIEITDYDWPILKITCHVSSGTYVRSLARDLGEKLGCGAYLSALRRTRIGVYELAKAQALTKL